MATKPHPWPKAAEQKRDETEVLARDIIQLAAEARKVIVANPLECKLMLADIGAGAERILRLMVEARTLGG